MYSHPIKSHLSKNRHSHLPSNQVKSKVVEPHRAYGQLESKHRVSSHRVKSHLIKNRDSHLASNHPVTSHLIHRTYDTRCYVYKRYVRRQHGDRTSRSRTTPAPNMENSPPPPKAASKKVSPAAPKRSRRQGTVTAEAAGARNTKRRARPVSKKESASQDTGRELGAADAEGEAEAVSEIDEEKLFALVRKGVESVTGPGGGNPRWLQSHSHYETMLGGLLNYQRRQRNVERFLEAGLFVYEGAEDDFDELLDAPYPLAPPNSRAESVIEEQDDSYEMDFDVDDVESIKKSVEGVRPYRNIDSVFLPLPGEQQVTNTVIEQLEQSQHRTNEEPEASASALIHALGMIETSEMRAQKASEYLINDIGKQMMYVSGETGEPSADTTGMIEEIVRQQVVEIVSTSSCFML